MEWNGEWNGTGNGITKTHFCRRGLPQEILCTSINLKGIFYTNAFVNKTRGGFLIIHFLKAGFYGTSTVHLH